MNVFIYREDYDTGASLYCERVDEIAEDEEKFVRLEDAQFELAAPVAVVLDERSEFCGWCADEDIDPKTEMGCMMWEARQARACLDLVKEMNQ